MKKIKTATLVGIACLTLIFTVAFAACFVFPAEELSENQQEFIRRSYFNSLKGNYDESEFANIKIHKNLGIFNNNFVVIIHFDSVDISAPAVVTPVYVNGKFITEFANPLYEDVVCTPSGDCMDLQKAFDNGLIKNSDLSLIKKRANA